MLFDSYGSILYVKLNVRICANLEGKHEIHVYNFMLHIILDNNYRKLDDYTRRNLIIYGILIIHHFQTGKIQEQNAVVKNNSIE